MVQRILTWRNLTRAVTNTRILLQFLFGELSLTQNDADIYIWKEGPSEIWRDVAWQTPPEAARPLTLYLYSICDSFGDSLSLSLCVELSEQDHALR